MSHHGPYAQFTPPPPPPRRNNAGKAIGLGCAGVFALAVFGGCVAAITDSGSSGDRAAKRDAVSATESAPDKAPKTTNPTPKEKESAPVKKKKKKKAAPAPEAPTSYSDGDYQVGVDIQPGTYISVGAQKGLFELCSASTEPTDGSFGEWETANADEQVILTVGPNSGVVSISGCEPFVLRK